MDVSGRSDGYTRMTREWGKHAEAFRSQQPSWRRRAWASIKIVILPAILVVIGFALSPLTPHAPPGIPAMWPTFVVLAVCCVVGERAGLVAVALILAALSWEMRRYPLREHEVWAWYALAVFAYASIVIASHLIRGQAARVFRARPAIKFLRKPLKYRHQSAAHRAPDRLGHHKHSRAIPSGADRSAPRAASGPSLAGQSSWP